MSTLQLADGRTLDLSKKTVVGAEKAAPDDEEPLPLAQPIAREQVKLEDLPGTPAQMNVVCAVVGYKLLGLPHHDISIALGCSDTQLVQIMNSEAYTKAWTWAIEAYQRGQTETAKDIISSNAVAAAMQLVKVATKSKNESNRIRASESVLNRAGISDGQQGGSMGGLTIRILQPDNATSDISIKVGA